MYLYRDKPKELRVFLNFSFANDAIGYIIEGPMDAKAINTLKAEILKKFEDHQQISLYLEDAGINGFSFDSVIIATLFPHEHKDRFRKVAMVTDRKWIHMLSSVNSFLLGGNFRNFTTENRLNAIAWISEE